MSKFVSKAKGFTLIELLVVIAIIGVLASIAMTSFGSARAKARDAKRVADLRQIQTALQLYFDSTNTYPFAFTDLVPTYLPNAQTYTDPQGGAYKYDPYLVAVGATLSANRAVVTQCNSTTPCLGYQVAAEFELGNATIVDGSTGVANTGTDGTVTISKKATATGATNCAAAGTKFCYSWRQN